MGETHRSRLHAAPEREILKPPRPRRDQSALQRAIRQERVARRRNFFGWLLTVLIAAGACAAIIVWVASRPGGQRPALSPTTATPTAAPQLPAASEPALETVPVGAEHALPAR